MALLQINIIYCPERENSKELTLTVEWNHSHDDIMRVTVNPVVRIHRLVSVGFVFMLWKKDKIYKQIQEHGHNVDFLKDFAKFSKVKKAEDISLDQLRKFYEERIELIPSMYYKIESIKWINKFLREYGCPYIMKLDETVEIKVRPDIIATMKKVHPNDPTPKTRRNKKIVELKDKGWSYSEICSEFGFRSKGTPYKIYHREKSRLQ